MGTRTNEVFFDDVKIPVESLIGEENKAWDYVVESGAFYWNRQFGMHADMKELLQELVQYVKETQVDGQPLSQNALVRHKLAEMAIGIEGLRLHTYRLAWAFDKGLDIIGLGAVTKFQSDRLALHFSNSAMQLLGPYGQLERDAKYAPLKGAVLSMYKGGVLRSFSSTGPSAMPSVIAGYMLGLPNEFGLIY
jgi:alkylation response protein AidB-like acyl-CoA dehydrogenase